MDSSINNYYDSIAGIYDSKYSWKSIDKEILILFKQYLKEDSVSDMWDLGCGPGKTSRFFAERGFKVVSVDSSRAMIKIARKWNYNNNIDYIKTSIEQFLGGRSKNKLGILCLFSLIHYSKKDSKQILKSIFEKCKSGSLILLGVQLGKDEIIQSPITKRPISIFGWGKNELEEIVKNLGTSIKFSLTRSSWDGELPREKLFLILKVK